MSKVNILFWAVLNLRGSLSVVNVHLIVHSHDDPGWKETPDWYYSNYVKPAFDIIISILLKDTKKTFNYCEIWFFEKYFR